MRGLVTTERFGRASIRIYGRTHTIIDGGLPAHFDPARLKLSHTDIDLPVWGYTRDGNQIFVIGGSPVVIDSFTKMIMTGRQIPIGGESQRSGRTRFGQAPRARRRENQSSDYARKRRAIGEGKTVNYTRGKLIHQNGFVYAVAQSVLYKIDAGSMGIASSVDLPLVGGTESEQAFTTYNGMQVLGSGEIVLKGFDLIDNSVSGWLLLVDPDKPTIKIAQPAQVSSPRMTIDQRQNPAKLYLLNAGTSTRYLITEDAFRLDMDWTASYITPGSAQASSPVFFGNQIAFSDNTFPYCCDSDQTLLTTCRGSSVDASPSEGVRTERARN